MDLEHLKKETARLVALEPDQQEAMDSLAQTLLAAGVIPTTASLQTDSPAEFAEDLLALAGPELARRALFYPTRVVGQLEDLAALAEVLTPPEAPRE